MFKLKQTIKIFCILFCICYSLATVASEVNYPHFSLPTTHYPLPLTHYPLKIVYRVPAQYNENSRIMVLFGGRNWPGEKTLKAYGFDTLADKHQLFLLSPSFVDHDYWEPEQWSGEVLKKALAELRKRYKLKKNRLYFYGYSAGGQCANLFYAWMQDEVAAWSAHGCGVYFNAPIKEPVPALITCGLKDEERFQISRQFIYRYREAGGQLLWKTYQGVHELSREALELARAWFDAILASENIQEYGEDDTGKIRDKNSIDLEFRNPFHNTKLRELWLR